MVQFTDMFNSKGELVRTNTSKINFASQQVRKDELGLLAAELFEMLTQFKIHPKAFDFALQPYGMDDRLLWFSKMKLEGDSDLVKFSQTAVKNPDYQYKDRNEEAIFKSVVQHKEDGKVVWYLLNVEAICLTRNMQDMRYIKAELEEPIPYFEFMERSKENRISKEELAMEETTDKIKYLAYGKNYFDVRFMLQYAITRKDADDVIDGYIQTGLNHYRKKYLEGCDEWSNDKTYFLMLMNDSRCEEQYSIYERLKKWCNKPPSGERVAVSYRGNRMILRQGDKNGEIFVSKDPIRETPIFLVNGKVVEDTDSLKAIIESGDVFGLAPLWWDEIKALNKK